MSEENKQLVLRQIEAVNAGDLDAAERLTHGDFFDHEALPSRANGSRGARETIRRLHETFAGFRVEPLDVVAEGDRVVVRARVSGRQVGPLAGMPAGGREFSVQQLHIWRVRDGLLVEHWACRDELGLLRQLGLLDPLPRPRRHPSEKEEKER
jgi:steroid delta-isomerase-like uncharacterized protein